MFYPKKIKLLGLYGKKSFSSYENMDQVNSLSSTTFLNAIGLFLDCVKELVRVKLRSVKRRTKKTPGNWTRLVNGGDDRLQTPS